MFIPCILNIHVNQKPITNIEVHFTKHGFIKESKFKDLLSDSMHFIEKETEA